MKAQDTETARGRRRLLRLTIDMEASEVAAEWDTGEERVGLGTPEGFELVSRAWLRSGWDTKYVYSFSWLGRPIIQLPEDMVRLQELITAVSPDVVLETGVAHGGSLVFHASVLKALGRGRVIGVDVEIRPSNRAALDVHPLASMITLVEGDSIAPDTVAKVTQLIAPGETVLLILDSNHSKAHVRAELELYGPLVSPGSYAIAMDGIMEAVAGAPRTGDDWAWNNPRAAAVEFAADHPEFELCEPSPPFNEGDVIARVTYSPDGFLRRVC